MSVKEEIHQLLEGLPESDLLVVKRLLHGLRLPPDPATEADELRAFLESCPEEDEPIPPEEEAAVARSWADYDRGALVPHQEVVRRSRERRGR